VFTLQIPYRLTKENVAYLVRQYRQLIDHVTSVTGKKFDPDRLAETIRLANESRRLVVELYDLCKNVPSPAAAEDLKNFALIFALLAGLPEGTHAARRYVEVMRDRVEQNIAGLPGEKYRLLWVQNRIQFNNRLLKHLEQNYGANIVIDELNYVFWDELDPDNALEDLARRQIITPLNGDIHKRLDVIKKLSLDYGIHGAINPSHWGCRQNCAGRHLIKDALREVGVPMINLDVDCVDDRNFSEGQYLTRLEGFMEMLATAA